MSIKWGMVDKKKRKEEWKFFDQEKFVSQLQNIINVINEY